MKVLTSLILTLYSGLSLADYKCSEVDSDLFIKITNTKATQANLFLKGQNAGKKVSFNGFETSKDAQIANGGGIMTVTKYKLSDSNGAVATLSVSSHPAWKPCIGRRICDDSTEFYFTTAELDYQGQLTHYNCENAF